METVLTFGEFAGMAILLVGFGMAVSLIIHGDKIIDLFKNNKSR